MQTIPFLPIVIRLFSCPALAVLCGLLSAALPASGQMAYAMQSGQDFLCFGNFNLLTGAFMPGWSGETGVSNNVVGLTAMNPHTILFGGNNTDGPAAHIGCQLPGCKIRKNEDNSAAEMFDSSESATVPKPNATIYSITGGALLLLVTRRRSVC